jgi:hypothetical protein
MPGKRSNLKELWQRAIPTLYPYLSDRDGLTLVVSRIDLGVVTALARHFPEKNFMGILPKIGDIMQARKPIDEEQLPNAKMVFDTLPNFRKTRPQGMCNTIIFMPPPHVPETCVDTWRGLTVGYTNLARLLVPGGQLIVCDLMHRAQAESLACPTSILKKLQRTKQVKQALADFVGARARSHHVYSIAEIVQFLLSGVPEIVPEPTLDQCATVSIDRYVLLGKLLDLRIVAATTHLLPALKRRWIQSFGFTTAELALLHTFGIVVAQS